MSDKIRRARERPSPVFGRSAATVPAKMECSGSSGSSPPSLQTAKGLGSNCPRAYGVHRIRVSTGLPWDPPVPVLVHALLQHLRLARFVQSLRRDRTNDLAWRFPDRSGCCGLQLQVARSLCCRHSPRMAAMGQRSTAVEPGPGPKIGPGRRRTAASHRPTAPK